MSGRLVLRSGFGCEILEQPGDQMRSRSNCYSDGSFRSDRQSDGADDNLSSSLMETQDCDIRYSLFLGWEPVLFISRDIDEMQD